MTEHNQKLTIAIDGPAGAGKSTIAKKVAQRLNISYLDTGAMYRALTLKALRSGTNLEDPQALINVANNTKIEFKPDPEAGLKVLLDGEDVSEAIRETKVTNNTFYMAREAGVREVMVKLQRKIGNTQSVVAEGRDIGTVVFPDASNKFYLDADFEERARRRIAELKEKGKIINDDELKKELKARDDRDFTRQAGPLKKADDAVVIDSTGLSADQVADQILKHIKTHG